MKRDLALVAVGLVELVTAGALARAADTPPTYLGTWTARLSQAQMINQGLDPRLAGAFRLVLRQNGTYSTFNSFDGPSHGRFTAKGSRIVFFADAGCRKAKLDARAPYTWSISHGRLRLATVELGGDLCGGRWQTLTYPLWKRTTSRRQDS